MRPPVDGRNVVFRWRTLAQGMEQKMWKIVMAGLVLVMVSASSAHAQWPSPMAWSQFWTALLEQSAHDTSEAVTGEVLSVSGAKLVVLLPGGASKGQLLDIRRTVSVPGGEHNLLEGIAQVLVTANYEPLVLAFAPRLRIRKSIRVGDRVSAVALPIVSADEKPQEPAPAEPEEAAESAIVVLVNGRDIYLDRLDLVVGTSIEVIGGDGVAITAQVEEVTPNMSRVRVEQPVSLHRGDEVGVVTPQ